MTTELYEPPVLPPAAPNTAPFRLPADYYSTDLSAVRPIFPRWVAFGCGIAAIGLILLLVVAGAWLAGGGGVIAIDWMFGQLHTELKPMLAKDVTAGQKSRLDGEIKTLRANMKSGKVTFQQAQPVLQVLQKVIGDQTVTKAEVDQLNGALDAANAGATKPRPPGK
jgi:hypothetical protein